MSVVGKRIRLVGIMGEGTPIVRARLQSKDAPAQEKRRTESFTLRLDDGTDVRIVPDENVEIVGPQRTERGTWGALSALPLAVPFEGLGPGPHVSASLAGVVIAPGDRVAVAGAVTDADPIGEPSYREQQRVTVSEVRATILAIGPGAEERVDIQSRPRRDASRRLPWRSILVGAVAIAAVCAVVKAIYTSPAILIDLLVFVLASAAMFQNQDTTPEFEPESGWTASVEVLGFLMMGLAVFGIVVSFVCALFSWGDWPGTGPILAGCVLAATTSVVRRTGQRRSLAIARAILDAPDDPKEGAWGRIAGIVTDPTPVKVIGGVSALSRVTDGAARNIVTDGTFLVTAGNTVVEVVPDDAVWSSSVRAKAERTVKEGEKRTTFEELIPVGGKAVVVARMHRKEGALRAASTGPESLLLYATADAEEPIAKLRQFVASHRRGTIVQLVLFGIAVATAFGTVFR